MSDTRAAVIGAIGVGAIAAASFFSGGEPAAEKSQPQAAVQAQAQAQDAGAQEAEPRFAAREAAKARAHERMVKRIARENEERAKAQEGHGSR